MNGERLDNNNRGPKTAQLLRAEEIMQRLIQQFESEALERDFYPWLAAMGGYTMSAAEIVGRVKGAADDVVTKYVPFDSFAPILMRASTPDFIGCLSEDPEVIEEAKQLWMAFDPGYWGEEYKGS